MKNFTAYFVDIEYEEKSEATAIVENIPCLPVIGTNILIHNHLYRVIDIEWIIEKRVKYVAENVAYVKIRIMRQLGT